MSRLRNGNVHRGDGQEVVGLYHTCIENVCAQSFADLILESCFRARNIVRLSVDFFKGSGLRGEKLLRLWHFGLLKLLAAGD